jgi:F0F1-type ATP synthase membrane subunit b/b'
VHVPAGYTTPSEGYYGTVQDGRDTLEALAVRREERDAWRAAYQDLRAELASTTEEMRGKLAKLETQINAERQASRAAARRNVVTLLLVGAGAYIVGR